MNMIILACFMAGYLFIALENKTKINKASIALITCVTCWILLGYTETQEMLVTSFQEQLSESCQTVLFLLAAMIVIEMLNSCGCFRLVAEKMRTSNMRVLLWKTTMITFVLSAVLDNMTTSILMVTILRSLVADRQQRIWLACMVILSANAGGAFSPIGDVTTIMLWLGGCVSGSGIVKGLLIPSIACVLVPLIITTMLIHGNIRIQEEESTEMVRPPLGRAARTVALVIGTGGLVLTPVFHNLTGLPPFMGVMTVMAVLWMVIELLTPAHNEELNVSRMCSRIDISTLLFFLGILLSVGALKGTGMLEASGTWLQTKVHNIYMVNALIGLVSSVIDNVPLVASAMSMYPIETSDYLSAYCQDGTFWELLAYCAGTGGSMLIIGSAAGVVVMGIEHISFTWYLKHFTPLALAGYIGGLAVHWLQTAY